MKVEPAVDPCRMCGRRTSCRLPLNCGRYLQYRRELERRREDKAELRRCALGGEAIAEDMTPASKKRYRAMAQALPWRRENG